MKFDIKNVSYRLMENISYSCQPESFLAFLTVPIKFINLVYLCEIR